MVRIHDIFYTLRPKIAESREEGPDVSEQIAACSREWTRKSKCGQNRAFAEPSKKKKDVRFELRMVKNAFSTRKKTLAGWLGWLGVEVALGLLGGKNFWFRDT